MYGICDVAGLSFFRHLLENGDFNLEVMDVIVVVVHHKSFPWEIMD